VKVEVVTRNGVDFRVDVCSTCGKPFEQRRKQGRPRLKCDTCSGAAAPVVARGSMVMGGDPPVRPDGRCACGCGRKRQVSKDVRTYAGAQIDMDPFATSDCCKRWYEVSFAPSAEEQDAAELMGR
jgi:hypothetical protein